MNPEQPVLDEIDRLVGWQLEEGQRRGDGPEPLPLPLLPCRCEPVPLYGEADRAQPQWVPVARRDYLAALPVGAWLRDSLRC